MTGRRPALRPGRWRGGAALILVAGALLAAAGCGEKKKDRIAAHVAARVNGEEVTLAQINLVLQDQRSLGPELADAASRQILERLIDQELAVQKTEELRLDRDPRVAQLVDAARRQVLARAYADKLGERAVRPSPEDVRTAYAQRPAMYRERRIYTVQELAIEARPEQVPALREQLAAAGSIAAFTEALKAGGFRFVGSQAVRTPEQLAPQALAALSRMKDGQGTIVQVPSGVVVTVLVDSRSQPLTEEQARPLIEQHLLAERRRALVLDGVRAMRGAASIEYLGRFAEGPRGGAADPAAGALDPALADPTPAPTSPELGKPIELR